MRADLTEYQVVVRSRVRDFVKNNLDPVASQIDASQTTPTSLIRAMAEAGWLGAALPTDWGGGGLDPLSYGLVTEEVGRASSAVRSLMTVHNMSAQAIVRFGSKEQRARWLPFLCKGQKTIAFALTEPDARGAAGEINTSVKKDGSGYRLTGRKTWITYGQIADLFLVFAREDQGPGAFIVERGMPGFTLDPIVDPLGTRGSMLAHLHFDQVRLEASHKIGATGAGLSFVANTALDHGRFSVAWGATGIVRGCLEASASYAGDRNRGANALIDHQLIQRRLTNILMRETTSRALCYRAANFRHRQDARAAAETSLAKYHAADAAFKAATDAVAIHGGDGCSASFPIGRYMRDATVLNIIEGTQEMLQIALSSYIARKLHAEG
jgi:glutaryl-CoA dehydrogenase (non-decarboxylating)